MLTDISKCSTKAEKHAYLLENKRDLIEFKKAQIKFSAPFGTSNPQKKAQKSLNTTNKDDLASGIIRRTIVGNTYNWIDSQQDCLITGCCTKSISERADKIWHLHDHEQMLTAKVGNLQSIYEQNVKWADLGVNNKGQTQCLMADSEILADFNAQIFQMYAKGEIDQHSIGFYYVKLILCLDDPEQKEEYASWLQYYDRIGNKEIADENGYFWAVTEIKLIEISCVLEGSNELTPTVENIQPKKTAVQALTETLKAGTATFETNEPLINLSNVYSGILTTLKTQNDDTRRKSGT